MNASYKEWTTQPRRIIGIMSGTSLDGIDVSVADYSTIDNQPQLTTVAYTTVPFRRELYTFIRSLIEQPITIADVCDANMVIARAYCDAIDILCTENTIDRKSIDAIGMHGQTVWHSPLQHFQAGYDISSTLQLGSVSAVAQWSGITTVGDFRSADVALSGQGAPLVPIFDEAFLRCDIATIALNIGGIANITILPNRHDRTSPIIAFDTGAGNVWIDKAMMVFYGKRYDTNGSTARAGRIIPHLFERLKTIPGLLDAPPKSTGREYYTPERFDEFTTPYLRGALFPYEDIVCTLSEFTAWAIAENIRLYAPNIATIPTRIVVSGGGAYNSYILDRIQAYLPYCSLILSDDIGIDSSAKEALCFGYLAYKTLSHQAGNLPSVTGALHPTILGVVAYR